MKSTAGRPAEFVARGVLTREEALLRLVLEACHEAPAMMASDLPRDLIASLREYCADPPASPEQAPVIGGTCGGLPPHNDPASWRRLANGEWYEGMVRWHSYFQAAPC